MPKYRILHVIPSLSKGGAERLAIDICNNLQKLPEVEVKLVSFHNDNAYNYLTEAISCQMIDATVIPSITGSWKVNIDEYLKFVDSFKPDIIHSHLFEAEIITRYDIDSRIKYVTHLHDNMPQFENLGAKNFVDKKKLANLYEKRWILKQYQLCHNNFIAISKDTEEYFQRCLPSDLRNITLMHNAIDISRFSKPGKANRLEFGKADIRLVTTGALVAKKNQAFLIDVVKMLSERDINVHLDILGDGPDRQAISEKIIKYDLSNRISLHGNVDNVEDYLHRGHIYVHAATYEPFGLVLLEAMAAGLPCIAIDGKGNRDIISEGKNGFLLAQPDAILFSQKIIQLIEDEKLYDKISKYASEFTKAFDMESYSVRLLDYYSKLPN